MAKTTEYTYDNYFTSRVAQYAETIVNSFGSTENDTYFRYDANGATTNIFKSMGTGEWKAEQYQYGFTGLVTHLLTNDCKNENIVYDWDYRYSPLGGRESKRLWMHNGKYGLEKGAGFGEISTESVLDQTNEELLMYKPVEMPWKYYLRGASGDELAQYGGVREGNNVTLFLDHYSIGNEYFAYPDGEKEYMITDHLGSVRVAYNTNGDILSANDYLPFGDTLSSTGRASHRRWIGCERDAESETGEHGMPCPYYLKQPFTASNTHPMTLMAIIRN